MRTLYLRIFLAFWAAMVLVLTFTIMATLWLSDQRMQHEQQHQEHLARRASSVLAHDGIPGLRTWLADQSSKELPNRLYVLDRYGKDLLGRRVPEFLQASVGRRPFPANGTTNDGGKVRLLSQLVSPTNETYALSLLRGRPPSPFGIFQTTTTPVIAVITTLLVSMVVCFLLSRYLSDPIRLLRAATHSIADGDLRVRVAALMGRRRDELALLATDFDVMAERLRVLLDSQQQLLRDVSHELRSPLARLQIALGLARRPGANLEQEFDRIERETQRLDELIGEILSLSRLEDPTHELIIEPVNLGELLEVLAENARLEGEPHWIRIESATLPDMEVDGDRELLYRALENVVRNAVRFSPNGGVVELSLLHREPQHALIRVVDHGPGVPPDLLERIFEPFFRVGSARDRDSGGHGIGLAITARVVSLHGGTVKATNIPTGGLQVDILLPRNTTVPRPALQAPSRASALVS